MRFHAITLFPDYFKTFLENGIVGAAAKKRLFSLNVVNPRDFTERSYKNVDDQPYGGGDGMVMAYEPLAKALDAIAANDCQNHIRIYLSPQGIPWSDSLAKEMAKSEKEIVFICGRYAGVDERFIAQHVDMEISVGDYVVSGGELPALICLDAILRHVPGVLGNEKSPVLESFHDHLLEAPVYTRPAEIDGMKVPPILTEGNHEKIAHWRRMLALLRTFQRRPDLFSKVKSSKKERMQANELLAQMSEAELQICGLKKQGLPLDDC